MLAAVRWLGEREGWTTAALITDIMSLLQALQGRGGGGCRVENIRRELWDLYGNGKQVGLAWVPGHCGLPGNEAADEMARRGSELAQERVGVDLATRMAVARRGTRRSAQLTHHRLKEVYAGGLRCGGGRAHEGREVMLVRFRTGHHPVLRRWQAMVDESWWMNGGWIRGGDDGAPVAGVWGPGGGEAHFRPGRGAERINFQTYTVPGVTQDHPEKPGRCQLNKQANSNAINNLSPTKNIFKSSEFKPEIQLFK